jgi:hypothetical protein
MMNYKQFVQKLFMAWGLTELAVIIFSVIASWADTTANLNEVIGRVTLIVAMLICLIFLVVTVISASGHD